MDLTPPPDRDKVEPESQQIIGLLENQIADLRSQLEKTETQFQIATTEKSKLLDLLSAEKDEKRALMPPLEEKNQEPKGWLLRLIGCAIVLSNQKSDLPNFHPSDTLCKSSLGGTTMNGARCSATLLL